MAFKSLKKSVDKLTLGNAYLNPDNSERAEDFTERRRQSGYSSHYHKYFEGYVERHITDEKGKVRIERIYAGDTYRHKLSTAQWVGLKLLYIAMFLASVVLYVFTISRHMAGYTLWYIKLAQALGVLILLLLLYTVFNYTIAKRNLTIYGYKESSGDLKLRTLFAAVGSALPILAQLVHIAVSFDAATLGDELLSILGCALSSLILLAIRFIEDKVIKYDKIPCTGDVPSDAVSIW